MSGSDNASSSDREIVVKEPPIVDWPSDKMASETQKPAEEEWKPSKHEKAIIYTLAFLNLIVSLDATIIVTSLSAIISELQGTTTQAFWIATSYLLVNAVTMPMICSVSDIIGRPICLTFSIAAFSVGTLLCCTAHSITQMIVGRCIQGVGGGGIHSLGLVIHTDFVPLRWRPKWYSVTLAAWAVGLSIGPVTGGAIADRTTWRWIFYIMLPICGFGLVVVPYLLTLRPKEATFQEKLRRIDWLGGFIFTGSATAFLIAISWGGSQHAWNSAATLVPLVLGIVGLIATSFYVGYIAKYPFIPSALFKDISSIITYIGAFLQGVLNFGTQSMCKPGDEGAAAAMYIFARQFGMAVGVGIGASTFQNVMKLKLRWEGLDTSIADYAESYIPTLHLLPVGHVRDATYDSFKLGFQVVFATWLGISVLALFLTLVFVKHADMNRKLDSDHTIDSTRMFRHWDKKRSSMEGVRE
ncbi:putative transporter C3H1.06c [Daldinia childiae]|uniref:putative transporter C3H1.06c n=1 Tax=Daldinia childiae TaxID=326645 RepID=UPI0014474A7C|nr:putative transporter C3H1.06c [Daldinia childiae]KAF3059652.1 putative transporter C3H1.06c [Daldinia childiae]